MSKPSHNCRLTTANLRRRLAKYGREFCMAKNPKLREHTQFLFFSDFALVFVMK
ncbi:MAG: hypothetical protein ACRCUY_05555 [Thermoguttaceae bacterium]